MKFNFKLESNFTRSEKLLYYILEELKKLNSLTSEIKEKNEDVEKCKNCGLVHENVGSKLACAKKYKNGGVVDGGSKDRK